jgi:hypothetical protein
MVGHIRCSGTRSRRTAILLIGGDKTGNDRFYEQFAPLADSIYEEYLKEIKKEEIK